MSTKPENFINIGPVFSEIFSGKSQFFPIIPKVAICHLEILGVTGLNDTKFVHNIQKSLPFNTLKSELRSFRQFINQQVN